MRNFNSKSLSQRRYAIPLVLMAVWVLRLLIDLFADDKVVWEAFGFLNSALYAIAASWALFLLPYTQLRLKFLAAIMAGAAWADLAWVTMYYVSGWSGYNAWLCWLAAGSVGLFLFVWFRSYHYPELQITESEAFLLRLKPKDGQSFLIALTGWMGPYGGYSIYYNGNIYAFRKGIFQRFSMPYNLLSRYHVSDVKIPSMTMISRLNQLIGSRWSIFNNCLKLKEIWDAE